MQEKISRSQVAHEKLSMEYISGKWISITIQKHFKRKKGALAQSECLKQAPTQIKKLYNTYYIGKEKEFIELLFYIQEHNNLDRIMKAVNQLSMIGPSHVTTEKIIFICEQVESTESPSHYRDEITDQSEHNLKAYAELFQQQEEEVMHCG